MGAPRWLGQLSIQLGSSRDLTVHEFEPCIGLSAVSTVCFKPSAPLSLCPPLLACSLSLSKINIENIQWSVLLKYSSAISHRRRKNFFFFLKNLLFLGLLLILFLSI